MSPICVHIEYMTTDGHRLSYTQYEHKLETSEQLSFIVSRKTLLELLKLGTDGELLFNYDKNNLFFKHNNRVLSSRIIDQKFPNYKAVIPEKTELKANIQTDQLLETLRRVLIFKTRNNGVIFKFSTNKLILERTTPEKGEAHEELEIEYGGRPFDVAFNGNFIIDFLTHVESDMFQVGMNDVESSFIFKPMKESDPEFTYVVMPLNI